MKSISLAALLAAGIFALYSAPSFAAATTPGGPKPPCTVNCGGGGDTTEPGDPFNPPGGDDPNDEPGGGSEDDPKDDPTEPGDDPEDNPNDDPTEPGDDPEDNPNDDPNDEPGNDPEFPGLSKQEVAELRACLARLDDLPQVSATQINQFGQPYKVSLKPICETQSLTEVGNAFIENGNVFGLEPVLKSNPVIKDKLGQSAYKPRDVVGIDFDADGNAILLVHKRRG